MIGIVVSRADSASEHIGDRLLECDSWTEHEDSDRPAAEGGGTFYRATGFELRTFDELHIHLDDPSVAFEGPDLIVFVSRHSGETGPLLTAHVTGNFATAEYGGEPGALAPAPPGAEKRVVEALARHAPDGYDVCIECTHHGPSDVGVPSMFVELGSDEPQWSDPAGARAVARAVLSLREAPEPDLVGSDGKPRHVVGFGGGHYAPRFTRIVRETEWAVGHVAADWALAEMGSPETDRAVIARAFERSRADLAVIEGDRPDLAAVVEDLGHRVVSETWLRAVGNRSLELVDELESRIAPVSEGLRFGDVAPETDDPATGVVVRPLPSELLARAQGIDPAAARSAVERHAVAFDTEQGGTRAAGLAAFPAVETSDSAERADLPAASNVDALVADLATVLESRYDTVAVEGDTVVAREAAFDPALAAERGVPEGPAFGRLAAGRSVEVDGDTIDPDAVTRTTVDRFPTGTTRRRSPAGTIDRIDGDRGDDA